MNNSLGWENVKQCIVIRCFLIDSFEKNNLWKKNLLWVKHVPFWWICDCLNHTKPLNFLILCAIVTQASSKENHVEILLYMIKPHQILLLQTCQEKPLRVHKHGLDWGLDFKNICILGAWHPYGKQARSWDTVWLCQESGSSQGVPAYPGSFSSCFQIHSVPQDGCVCPLQTSKLSPLFCLLAMAIRAFLCWDLHPLFLCFFSSAPSLFVCFKELSWRGSFTSRGELSTPPVCRLCQVTAPSAAGAWTRLKKNIIGIFNFPVWSWEMKSHHERSLPGAVSRWECQARWGTTEEYWSSIFIQKEFSSCCSGRQAGVQNEIPGVLPTGQHLKSLLNYSHKAVVTPNFPTWGECELGGSTASCPCRLQGWDRCLLGWCWVFLEAAANVTLLLLTLLWHLSPCGGYSKYTVFCLQSLEFVSHGFSQHLQSWCEIIFKSIDIIQVINTIFQQHLGTCTPFQVEFKGS